MKRLIIEPMPDLPRDPRAYRCLECGMVVPWSQWTPAQREAWEWDATVPNCCDVCWAGKKALSCETSGLGFVWEGE